MNRTVIRTVILAYLLWPVLPLSQSRAEAEFTRPLQEYSVTATFIYHLTKYVTWPEKDGVVTLCIFADNPVSRILQQISQDAKYRSAIMIREAPAQLNECHMIYFGAGHETQAQSLLPQIEGQPILTVSDIRDFARQGGHIGFVFDNGRVSMEVHAERVKQSGLSISAKLLETMRVITDI